MRMNERQKRLIEVYEHLRSYYGIHTKSGFAEALGYGRTSLSAAFSGKENYLTDSLFQGICQKWDGVFNLDYLLKGQGSLLLSGAKVPTIPQTAADNLPDSRKESDVNQSSLINALIAAKDETIAAMQDQLAAKEEIIQAKDELIAALRAQLAAMNYEKEIDKLGGYPRDRMASEPQIAPNR